MQPNEPPAAWPRRAAVVAIIAAVCGCSSLQSPRDTARRPLPRVPPGAPDDVPSAAMVARANPEISAAVARAIELVLRQPADHPRAAVLDFSAHSGTPRFLLIDRASGRVLQSLRVAHGQGSEGSRRDGFAEVFS